MAIPQGRTIKTLKGQFVPNKELSDSQDEIMALQGVPYALRQIQKIAKIKLGFSMDRYYSEKTPAEELYQMSMTSEISGLGIMSTAPLRALGVKTKNTETHVLDGVEFTKDEPVVGSLTIRMRLCTVADLAAERGELGDFLTGDWLARTDNGPDEYVVRWSVRTNGKNGKDAWRSEQVWGILNGRYSGKIKMTNGLGDSASATLVYDYLG
ncbi:hypothetical protein G7054_g7484 [Neopestalotiopsis clavispora]|nr:hypothetical protein E8E14_014156 [Neopestalotiopsis sp. 37M]KAF7532940.1 hypothetical protein G7054_g7484 [Neopestalotiopsis clavispora]